MFSSISVIFLAALVPVNDSGRIDTRGQGFLRPKNRKNIRPPLCQAGGGHVSACRTCCIGNLDYFVVVFRRCASSSKLHHESDCH